MCIILFSYKTHPRYPFILAANRDEFFNRPTAPLKFWEDDRDILAGRDLEKSGTWLGINKRTGHIAAVTNFRDPTNDGIDAKSRGLLVSDFLRGDLSPKSYMDIIKRNRIFYKGFNLLIGNFDELYYYSNQSADYLDLKPGVYGLSNHLLDTDWPKIRLGKKLLNQCLAVEPSNSECLFRLLTNSEISDDHLLPDTGVGIEMERMLSPIFLHGGIYGTRSSSIIIMDVENKVTFKERSYQTNHSFTEVSYQVKM